ncbi:hypothetical protein FN846DRAFT_932541 [Sphaerosporella brunnea]|uniref:Secreted protein n=1 Tax=Sphaerosporella brunnea TaxID=1250544 RepID=A0A5J5F7S7_9PEZI|nr:hypothetical protein FN846DRAFT_932541 [Sphaerosporella brunnea]
MSALIRYTRCTWLLFIHLRLAFCRASSSWHQVYCPHAGYPDPYPVRRLIDIISGPPTSHTTWDCYKQRRKDMSKNETFMLTSLAEEKAGIYVCIPLCFFLPPGTSFPFKFLPLHHLLLQRDLTP